MDNERDSHPVLILLCVFSGEYSLLLLGLPIHFVLEVIYTGRATQNNNQVKFNENSVAKYFTMNRNKQRERREKRRRGKIV